MTQQLITTTPANTGLGSSPKAAFDICNANFGDLYAQVGVVAGSAPSVLSYGATGNGTTDDSAAFAAAAAANTTFFVPPGSYLTNTALSGNYSFFSEGAPTYSGANPVLAWTPGFKAAFEVAASDSTNGLNAFVAVVQNATAASTTVFPTAVTAMGRNNNNGNTVFGIYAPAYQYATSGVVTNEIDSFNMTATPSSNLPPTRTIGTSQNLPVALTVAAGGSFASSIGIQIVPEGSSPQTFLTGMYINPSACSNFGVFVDAVSTSTNVAAQLKHAVGANCLQLQGIGTPVTGGSVILYTDGNSVNQFKVAQNGQVIACQGISVPSGGAQSVGYQITSTANMGIYVGSGAPTLTAAQGSLYLRTDGSSGTTRLYVNTTGSNVWTNFASAA